MVTLNFINEERKNSYTTSIYFIFEERIVILPHFSTITKLTLTITEEIFLNYNNIGMLTVTEEYSLSYNNRGKLTIIEEYFLSY